MNEHPALDPAHIFPTYIGGNELSPFHHCYANDQTVLRLAALFDVPERPVEISGPDAVAFLERIVARRIGDMKIDRGRYALICTHQGGIFMDGILFRLAETRFWFVHPDGDLEPWLLAHPKSRVLQLQGPNSFPIMQAASSGALTESLKYFHSGFFDFDGQQVYVSRTGWTGELGYELYTLGDQTDCPRLWDHLMQKGAPHGLVFSSMQAMNTRRIEAGILDSGSDFDISMTPYEAGLERFACSGDLILSGSAPVGMVTTGALSPYLKCGIGYARFDQPDEWSGKTLTLKSQQSDKVTCTIVDLPFYDPEKRLPRGLPLQGAGQI